MSRAERNVNVAAVIVPFAAVIASIVLLWREAVGFTDLAILTGGYLLTGLGITVGFHRLLTHRAFETYRPLRYLFAILGSMAVEGPVTHWVADHRKHHAFTDEEGDPHSPHAGRAPGLRGALQGLYHAHMGWLFRVGDRAEPERYAKELLEDRGMVLVNRMFVPLVILGLAIPFALGFAVSGTLAGGAGALVWGGLVRIFLLHHVTFSINSICHFFGRRRFETEDRSTNVFWLAPLSFGESWHHNHHAFPRSASHGLRWWEVDPGAIVIGAMRRLGLAWNVVRISAERQRSRAIVA